MVDDRGDGGAIVELIAPEHVLVSPFQVPGQRLCLQLGVEDVALGVQHIPCAQKMKIVWGTPVVGDGGESHRLEGVLHHRQNIGVETPALAQLPQPHRRLDVPGVAAQRHKHIRQLRQRLHQLQKFPALQPHPGVYADIVLGLAGDAPSVVLAVHQLRAAIGEQLPCVRPGVHGGEPQVIAVPSGQTTPAPSASPCRTGPSPAATPRSDACPPAEEPPSRRASPPADTAAAAPVSAPR